MERSTKRQMGWLALAAAGCCLGAACLQLRASGPVDAGADGPKYGPDGSLVLPPNYREWIFLSSGIDMSYGPLSAKMADHSMFDNVFVNPAAYRSFLANGTWPEKTMLVLERRGADTNPSINHGGHSQGVELIGREVHLKDTGRFAGGWAFFDVNEAGSGKLIPKAADCYSCHAEHAAVDTTFTQFYPTLLPIAWAKGTLSAAYLKEFGATAK